MAWKMKGQLVEACSCDLICPCVLGPAEPDQGWCSGAVCFNIQEGNSDAVSLVGCKVAWAVDLPKDFMSGGGLARLYIDEAANTNQRRELEAIFTGKRGGSFAAVGGLVVKWLPTQYTKVAIDGGAKPSASIGTIGQLKLERVKNEAGEQTCLEGSAVMRGFGVNRQELARSNGSYLFDADMKRWVAGGAGGASQFSLSA